MDLKAGSLQKGGPPQYQLPILLSYGVNSIDILTSTHDLNLIPKHDRVKIFNIPTETTTTYEFTKSTVEEEDDRVLTLVSKASDFTREDLEILPEINYDLIIISGIAGEITLQFIKEIRAKYPQSYVVLDAQTLIRSFDEDKDKKIVKTKSLNPHDILEIADIIQFGTIKGSSIEISNLRDLNSAVGSKYLNDRFMVLRTNSGKDVELLYQNQVYVIPVDSIDEELVIDSTGSGDIFLISFAMEYLKLNISPNVDKIITSIKRAHQITKHHLFITGIPTLTKSDLIIEYILSDFIKYQTHPLVLRVFFDVYGESDFKHAKDVFEAFNPNNYPELYIAASFAILNFHGWFAEGKEAFEIKDVLEKLKTKVKDPILRLFARSNIMSCQWFHYRGYNDWSNEDEKANELAAELNKFFTSRECKNEMARQAEVNSLPYYFLKLFGNTWVDIFVKKEVDDLNFDVEMITNHIDNILPRKFALQLQFYGGWESIGRFYLNRGKFDKAKEFFAKDTPYFAPYVYTRSRENLGYIDFVQGNVKQAIEKSKENLIITAQYGLLWAQIHDLVELAKYNSELQDFEIAENYLDNAYNLSLKKNDYIVQSTVLFELGNIQIQKYRKSGNRDFLKQATNYLEKIQEILSENEDARIKYRFQLLSSYINQYGTLIQRAKALETYYDLEERLTNKNMDIEISLKIIEMNIADAANNDDPNILEEISTRLSSIQDRLKLQEGNYPYWCKIQIILAQYYSTIFQEFDKAIDILVTAEVRLKNVELSFLYSLVDKELQSLKKRISTYLKTTLSVRERIKQYDVQTYIERARFILSEENE